MAWRIKSRTDRFEAQIAEDGFGLLIVPAHFLKLPIPPATETVAVSVLLVDLSKWALEARRIASTIGATDTRDVAEEWAELLEEAADRWGPA